MLRSAGRLIALLLTGAALTPTSALADDWPIVPIQPAANATLAPAQVGTYAPQIFEFRSPALTGVVDGTVISIWSRNPQDPGNLFPADSLVDYFPVFASPVDPTVFRGNATNAWRWTRGTYYWSAAVRLVLPTSGLGSPLFTFAVATPAYTPPAIVVPPAATSPSTSDAKCTGLRAHVRDLARHIRRSQGQLDRARTAKGRKRLRKVLRGLRRQRNAAQERVAERCA